MIYRIVFIVLLASDFATAQTSDDIYRYLPNSSMGSARAQSLGGASGFLEGDFSSIITNPAAGALFDYGAFSGSIFLGLNSNTATTGDSTNPRRRGEVSVNQAGGLLVFESEERNWNKIVLGFTYQQENNYIGNLKIAGLTDTGMDQYFTALASNQVVEDVLAYQNEYIEDAYLRVGAESGFASQQTLLGLYGGILGIEEGVFFSNADYTTVFQKFESSNNGRKDAYTIHGSASYMDKWLLGASFTIHELSFERFTYLDEAGYSTESAVTSSLFDNYLFTEGIGVSANFGLLWQPGTNFGLGISYKTPTWFTMSDLSAQHFDTDNRLEDISFINFDIINVYDDYTIKLPSSLTLNAKVVLSEPITFLMDYQRQNYGDAQLLPNNNPGFKNQNTTLATTFSTVESYRMGLEYTSNNYSARLGYGNSSSPYINSDLGKRNDYGLGFGLKYGANSVDLGLSYSTVKDTVYLFDQILSNAANVQNRRFRANVTYTFSL
jgi:hypothetical protein